MAKDIEDMISKIEKKQMDTASMKDEIRRLTQLTKDQSEKLERMQKTMDEQKKKLEEMVEVPTDVMELKVIIGRQRAEIEAFEDKISERDWRINELESELGMVKKQREELRVKLEEFRKKAGASSSTAEESETKIKELQAELQMTKEFLEAAGVTRGDVGELRIKLGQIDARVLEKEKVIEKLEAQLKIREEREISLLANIEKLQSELTTVEIAIKNAENAKETEMRSEMTIFQSELNQKKIDYAKLEAALTEKEVQIKNLQAEVEKKGEVDAGRQKKIQDIEKMQAHIARLQKMLEMEPIFKIYFIVENVRSVGIPELAKAIGSSIGQTRLLAFRLEKEGLLHIEGETVKFPL
jgi:chromosome segregation ATPase